MQSEVFDKLGMSQTSPDVNSEIIPNRARFYVRQNGQVYNAPTVDNSYKWAGGGFISTAEDLIVFGQSHLDHTLLNEETIRIFWTSQIDGNGDKTNYGIGWRTGTYQGRSYAAQCRRANPSSHPGSVAGHVGRPTGGRE